VLKPVKVNSRKYRYYLEQQVLDYQMILLLTTLGVSLDEIRHYLKNKGRLTGLFNSKKSLIKKQIKQLEFNLDSLDKFLGNLKSNGTMVKPEVKSLQPFGVFYIEKIGPYAKIGNYCQELENIFNNKGQNFTTLAIFDNPTYQPRQSQIKVGALANKQMKVKQ